MFQQLTARKWEDYLARAAASARGGNPGHREIPISGD
jgi:hypothetical protein